MLDQVYYHNTLREYAAALLTFLAVLGGFLAARQIIVGRLRWLAQRTPTKLDDLLVDLLEMVRNPECYLVALYFASRPLVLPGWADRGFRAVVIIVVTWRAATMLRRLARYAVEEGLLRGHEQDATYRHTSKTLGHVADFVVWTLALLFVLDNLGFSVSSMLAGLGIGGIAVALAAQAVLGDLFAAIAIYLDRPFVIGDEIQFGDTSGVVESIGFKTTRLRAGTGELLVVPNSALASSKIQNFRLRAERVVTLRFAAAYGTPAKTLAELPVQIRALILEAGGDAVSVDRVHLKSLADWAIQFEAVYRLRTTDFTLHMDVQQRVALALLEHLEKRGVRIPYPTQTVELARDLRNS